MPLKLLLMMNVTLLLLFGFLFALLAAFGYYFEISGYVIVAAAVFLVFLQWLISPKIIWWTTNMRLLQRSEYPWLWEAVGKICRKNKAPMPKLALARIGAPNAFVFGRTPGSATLVVTQGLLKNLTKDEVRAVVAHEVGHIKHNDMVVMTVVSVIPIIAYFIARYVIYAPSKDEKKSGMALVVGLVAFLVYFITNLLVLALSRLREYYADRFSGANTKPSLLASALAKITYGLSISSEKMENSAVRSFFIADPLSAAKEISQFSSEYSDFDLTDSELKKAMEWEKKNPLRRFAEFWQTHPLTYKRIAALKQLERDMAK